MKIKDLNKKLMLKRKTIANLSIREQGAVRGGALATNNCTRYDAWCRTIPAENSCPVNGTSACQ